MDKKEIVCFLNEVFPQIRGDFEILTLCAEHTTVRFNPQEKHLRPGGTVSGPAMFALVDIAGYIAILGQLGPEALVVTTNCSIDFMRKPAADTALYAEMKTLKLGRSLAVIDGLIFSEGFDTPVARATLTYSIPPKNNLQTHKQTSTEK